MIDFHTHCFPDQLAPRAMDVVSNHGEIPHYTDGTAADMLQKMDAAGIDKAVVLHIATNPGQQTKVNDFATKINGDRLISFGSVNSHAENAFEEIERIKKLGLPGVKFHPEYQEFDVTDHKYYPLWEACYENGLIMSFHAGKDIAYPITNMAHPKSLREISDHLPNAKIVFAHMGGWMQWNQVAEYLVGCHAYFDTSMTEGFIDPGLMANLVRSQGVEKILFGTDSPWADLQKSVDFVSSLGLSARELDLIFDENAAALLAR